jgi:two-component system cell cycle sensor histidine kinase/response regulator CckA
MPAPDVPSISAEDEATSLRSEVQRLTSELEALRRVLGGELERTRDGSWIQRLTERSPLGIFRTDSAGRFLHVNPALTAILGYDAPEELVGRCLHDMLAPGQAASQAADADCECECNSEEERWQRRDGAEIVVRIISAPVLGAGGIPDGCEAIVEDITEQRGRELLRRREERLASLGRMLAGIAHELNNPLAAICGFAQLLRRAELQEDDRAAVETIEREGQRAASIVRQLLNFARHDGSTRVEHVDVAEVLGYTMQSQRYSLETHGIRCLLDVPGEPLWVLADRVQLEQIILNLLVNARQACELRMLRERRAQGSLPDSPANGRTDMVVRLSAARHGGTVCLEVTDNGIGIPADQLALIWDPFWSTKPEGEGLGLGLSVVHAGVESLGGSINVRSVESEGTCFTVCLPASEKPGTGTGRSIETAAPRRARDVLLVGTAPIAPGFAERLLGAHGHAVIAAPSVEAAGMLLRDSSFDVVILNIPLSSGASPVEVVRSLDAVRSPDGPRIIVARRRLTKAVRDALEQMDGVVVLHHPGDVDELREAVEAGA